MVEEAVYKHEVESLAVGQWVRGDIGGHETTSIAPSSPGDVVGIDVDAEVVGAREVGGVRAWTAAHIEHPSRLAKIVVGQHGRQLPGHKRRLPHAIHQRVLEDPS